jgi:hypothetical protein
MGESDVAGVALLLPRGASGTKSNLNKAAGLRSNPDIENPSVRLSELQHLS